MRLLSILFLAALAACGRCENEKATRAEVKPVAAPSAKPVRRNWAPPSAPALPVLASAWSAAEASNTASAWDAVADAYERERARCVDDCLDDQYGVVLARKNAVAADPPAKPGLDERPALPPRVKALVAALDDYVKIAPADDPDVFDMKFLAANAQSNWHQPDAIARLEQLLRGDRSAPAAEYVANILLDALLRADRMQDL